jgi:uncharacterized protein YjiS (DUF1127 family)
MSNWTLTLELRLRATPSLRARFHRLGLAIGRGFDVIYLWLERARDRDRLAGMDPHLLKDIGVGRSEIEREVSKPFWRA